MEETQTQNNVTQGEVAPPAPEVNPLFGFIEEFAQIVPLAEFQNSFRITPNGLFVELAHKQRVLDLYRGWLDKKGIGGLSEEKLFKKLFGSENPTRFYLAEGKRCLTGVFVECKIQEPMKYRRPYYLGSPTSAADTIHPADPMFQSDLNVRSISGKTGLELEVGVGDLDFVVSLPAVRDFIKLAAGSKKVNERYPNFAASLSDGATTLAKILQKSKPLTLSEEPLRPLRYSKDGDKVKCRTRMGFYFYFNAQNRLIAFYHGFGLNFFSFVRDEVAFSLAKEVHGKIGSFEIFRRTHKSMASLLVRGKKKMIHAKAFAHFLQESIDAPNLNKEVKGVHTVKTFVEPFINALQLAEPIAPSKVESFLSPKYRRGHDISAFNMWLFVSTKRGLIVDAISRRSTNRREEPKK
jgi:hypothetical protein